MSKLLHIHIKKQTLFCFQNDKLHHTYPVSTAKNGVGNSQNSLKTPTGMHKIKLKIGAGCPINSIFVGRRVMGSVYSNGLAKKTVNKDWVLSRILWLQGLEVGVNRGKNIDSLKRYIYIHGTPDTEPMGTAQSHGCIRMNNLDVIELFDFVDNGTPVLIKDL